MIPCKNFKGMSIHFGRMHQDVYMDDYFSVSDSDNDRNTDSDSETASSTDQRQSTPKAPAFKSATPRINLAYHIKKFEFRNR